MDFAIPDALRQSPSGQGVVFSAGALWLVNALGVTRIEPWPELTAWTRRHGAPRWRRHRPTADFRALWPLKAAAELGAPMPGSLAAWSRLVGSIPEAAGDRVARFPSGHWRLVRLVAREPRAFDLFDNPALAFAVGLADRFVKRTALEALGGGERAVAALSRKKRRAIVGLLGFPASESTVRLLGRVPVEAVSVSLLRALRRLLVEDLATARTLTHIPVITAPLLDLVRRPGLLGVCSRPLLHRIGEWEPEVATAFVMLLEDTVDMAGILRASGHVSARAFPTDGLRDEEQLQRVHEILVDAMDDVEKTVAAAPLPPPPIAGNDHILPLRTAIDLLLEGQEQRSCVGGYAERVRARRAYVYRVLKPERATLCLVPNASWWRISELKKRLNRPVAAATLVAAQAWLDARRREAASPAPLSDDLPLFAEAGPPTLYRLRMRRVADRAGPGAEWRSVFSIREPEGAVLEVERGERGLVVTRLETPEGDPVHARTRAAVRRWLTRNRAAESAGRFDLVEARARRARECERWRRG